ncbi:MAG: DUF1304 domain-containing protein [Bacteroidia bacterium]|nr:DUF1304 domain-containing protein [Bacteroidia bacterium]
MKLAADIFVGLVIAIHVYIVWLEMFAWTTQGRKTFKSMAPNLFEPTKSMAANQGLYNGFLAAGLIWSFLIADPLWSRNVAYFFLGCVIVAGLYGAVTVQKRILFVQTIPAALAALFVYLASGN